ncbi:MAG: hypothetical protein OES47_12845, partial [Acidobacteriota bacterium]|nr:hypothetical protein [Acidobacteriota bacterium]
MTVRKLNAVVLSAALVALGYAVDRSWRPADVWASVSAPREAPLPSSRSTLTPSEHATIELFEEASPSVCFIT